MKNSNIEWTDHSWNPWYGCHKVSQGCAHCYMFREQQRFGRDPGIVQRSRTTFRAPLSWARAARRRQARQCVFTCSWSDFFIEDADAWRAEAWEIIRYGNDLVVNPEYREWINWRNHRAHLFALHSQIDWVIAGGESGPQARPCDPAWVRVLRDQCGAADVPFFFKQWGEYLPLEAPGVEVDYLGVGRKQAGRTLDGREWQERPQF